MDKRIVVRTPLTPGRLVQAYIDTYSFTNQYGGNINFEYVEEPLQEVSREQEVDPSAEAMPEFSIGDVSPYVELLPLLDVLKETQGSDTTFLDAVRAVISQNTPEDSITKLFPVFNDLVAALQKETATASREEEKFQKPIERVALETIATVTQSAQADDTTTHKEETEQMQHIVPTETEPEAESVEVKITKIITDEAGDEEEDADEVEVESFVQTNTTDDTLQQLIESGAAQAYQVAHYENPSLTMVVLDGNHPDVGTPTTHNTDPLSNSIFADKALRPGVVLHTSEGQHILRANPHMKVELRDVVRIVRVEEARKWGTDVSGESSRALSKPGELDELPGWNFDHEANTLVWIGKEASKLTSAEMTQAVYAGLQNELLEANCPPVGCRGPECYFFMYQLPRCKARKKESGWKADGTKKEPE